MKLPVAVGPALVTLLVKVIDDPAVAASVVVLVVPVSVQFKEVFTGGGVVLAGGCNAALQPASCAAA